MTVSKNATARTSRWLIASVIMTGFLTLEFARGQDYEAFERRLGSAVAEGEITLSQANTMMNTLRDNAPKTAIERRIQDIAEAVKAGKMSREQGAQAIEHTKRAMEAENKHRDHNRLNEPFMHRIREIGEAVKAGKLSREQGAQAIENTKRAMEAENKRRDHNQQSDPLMRRTRKIHESGEERTMSREQRARTAKDAKARGG